MIIMYYINKIYIYINLYKKENKRMMSMDFITWVEKIMRIKTETLRLG